MADIYKKRFEELNQQMDIVFSSKSTKYDSYSGKNETDIESNTLLEWKVKAKNLLSKACGIDSEHFKEFEKHQETGIYGTYLNTFERLRAIFIAAREDYEGGYLKTTRTLIQAELFDSELEQARALFSAGYKSAAAIVAGVVLENSLRELCDRSDIQHAKLDKMNADLAKIGIYNVLTQKRLTTLAGVRNSAAHGKSDEFKDRDVEDMIRDVERFISEQL
ncbi:hypothetical protein [Shewanella scandinavica]|uniref:DUF4145 domain-containing protein n=1 Tax=Shewanella scandinavica TaxID=3063538 RepID=A0ABU3G2J8_9GAMM|nr:hypothetical protein [Shewanella sp. SP2S1-2]MDT3281872.1 hypothetical protein [Shewanella sp. SP2S1-2]